MSAKPHWRFRQRSPERRLRPLRNQGHKPSHKDDEHVQHADGSSKQQDRSESNEPLRMLLHWNYLDYLRETFISLDQAVDLIPSYRRKIEIGDSDLFAWNERGEQNLPPAEVNPAQTAKDLFEDLQRRFPGEFHSGQLRTMQRRVREWRRQHLYRLSDYSE